MNVVLYTIECPKCVILEKKLEGKQNYTIFGSQTDPEAEIHVKGDE